MTVPVILSMTTIPSREGVIGKTLESLLKQTAHFDDLRVYRPPNVMRRSPQARITYCSTKDFGPVTKIRAVCDPEVPNDAIVVTVDDDIIYHPTWLETLLKGVEKHPNDACGFAGWNVHDFIKNKDGNFKPVVAPATCDVLEGFAGVAYRKHWFTAAVLSPPDFARNVDDVWI